MSNHFLISVCFSIQQTVVTSELKYWCVFRTFKFNNDNEALNVFLYTGYYLRAQSINIRSSFCNISMTWKHPQDADLITGYEVFIEEKTGYSWKKFDRIDVGNNTKFTSPCTLQSGRLYRTYIRSKIALRNPSQNISVDSYQYHYPGTYEETILGTWTFFYIYQYCKWNHSFLIYFRISFGN